MQHAQRLLHVKLAAMTSSAITYSCPKIGCSGREGEGQIERMDGWREEERTPSGRLFVHNYGGKCTHKFRQRGIPEQPAVSHSPSVRNSRLYSEMFTAGMFTPTPGYPRINQRVFNKYTNAMQYDVMQSLNEADRFVKLLCLLVFLCAFITQISDSH
ncbi:unnamed protein product [Onchocerca flexuosa]|uniref:Small conductance calcium-activated potassium channel protein n=1 Tax=Onchocerca flexuosa TaxID=387005 RepID=A0A183HDC2_9BILA|nr:unnamed protein product [Onchocerca flexuosa]